MNMAKLRPGWTQLPATLLAIALLVCACAGRNEATTTDQAATQPASIVDANDSPQPRQVSDLGGDPSLSCKTDADCAIKDVGSCCGYNPRCVNKDSPTFPEQVQAKCANDGRVGICGFPSISGCACVAGKCAGIPGADGNEVVR